MRWAAVGSQRDGLVMTDDGQSIKLNSKRKYCVPSFIVPQCRVEWGAGDWKKKLALTVLLSSISPIY